MKDVSILKMFVMKISEINIKMCRNKRKINL